MDRPYRYIEMDQHPPLVCVRLKQREFSDPELEDLGAEIARLVDEEGCRKLVLSLGPPEPQCLYSVFLAKLVNLQKRLENDGGILALADLNPTAQAIFEAAGLDKFFRFYPDVPAACAALK
jgi:STAS domain-containing protein